MSVPRIRLGIYGAGASGKTSFFRRLVDGNALPVAPGSRLAQFMNATMGADGRIVPTTTAFDNMEIRIDRTVFELGDWQGEALSEADDRLDMERRHGWSRNLVARQVRRSDAFFFFFDPSGQAADGRLQKHHNEELLRAKQLIDYILESRQNRLLPLMFILSHDDRVRKEPELLRMTDDWINEVDDYIQESYAQVLNGYYPRSLVRKENIFNRVSTTTPQHGEDLLNVMEKTAFLVQIAEQFRQRDWKRSIRLLILFIICTLLVLLVPLVFLSSPTAQKILSRVKTQAAPVLENLPSLPGTGSGQTDFAETLRILESPQELDLRTASMLNMSLFHLMKRLNELEDTNQTGTEEYAQKLELWQKSFSVVEKRFDRPDPLATDRDRLGRFGNLLMMLTDSLSRETPSLENTLQKYWLLYRQTLISEIRVELAVYRGANIPSRQLLRDIRNKLDKAFSEVSESKVRGISVRKTLLDSKDLNRKDELLRDIRKTYMACGYYVETYPVNIKIQSVTYQSETPIDRDYHYRVRFFGGGERKDESIDLTISSGFESDVSCTFLPSRKDFTVNFILDHPLQVAVQRKHRGNAGDWERVDGWEISSVELPDPSLKLLGLDFYMRYENDKNTSYIPEGQGFRLQLQIRRPRSVPELLWEIVDENEDGKR